MSAGHDDSLAIDLNKEFVSNNIKKDKILKVGEGNGSALPAFKPLTSGTKLATREELNALDTILQLRQDNIADRGDKVTNVDLEFTIREGKVVPDEIKATKARRGGNNIKRTKASESRLYSIADFKVGEVVEVKYEGDMKWHQATILTMLGTGQVRINYTGYNEEAVVDPNTHMRKLPLIEGWLELIDEESGSPYYLHQDTGETQWEKPTYQSEAVRKGNAKRGGKVVSRATVDIKKYSAEVSKYSGIAVVDQGRIDRHYWNSTATASAASEKEEKERERRRFTVNAQMSKQEKDVLNSRRRSFGPSSSFSIKKDVTQNQFQRRASFSKAAATVLTSSALPDDVEIARYKKVERKERFVKAANTIGLGQMRNNTFYKAPKVEDKAVAAKPVYSLKK